MITPFLGMISKWIWMQFWYKKYFKNFIILTLMLSNVSSCLVCILWSFLIFAFKAKSFWILELLGLGINIKLRTFLTIFKEYEATTSDYKSLLNIFLQIKHLFVINCRICNIFQGLNKAKCLFGELWEEFGELWENCSQPEYCFQPILFLLL